MTSKDIMQGFDFAIHVYAEIPWSKLTVAEARQAAIDLMATWDWQEKVPHYTVVVQSMDSVGAISNFMKNCILKGIEIKLLKCRQ